MQSRIYPKIIALPGSFQVHNFETVLGGSLSLPTGETLYILLSEHNSGTFGAIYGGFLGGNGTPWKHVAVKLMAINNNSSRPWQEECQTQIDLNRLGFSTPKIYATLTGSWKTKPAVAIVMDYVKGHDLLKIGNQAEVGQTIQDRVNQAKALTLGVLNLVKQAYQLGYLLADIKPEHFILQANGSLVYVDHGYTYPIADLPDHNTGNLLHMAPEVLEPPPCYDPKNVVFSAAIILINLIHPNCNPWEQLTLHVLNLTHLDEIEADLNSLGIKKELLLRAQHEPKLPGKLCRILASLAMNSKPDKTPIFARLFQHANPNLTYDEPMPNETPVQYIHRIILSNYLFPYFSTEDSPLPERIVTLVHTFLAPIDRRPSLPEACWLMSENGNSIWTQVPMIE